jgi:PTS system fructose-specific IIC component
MIYLIGKPVAGILAGLTHWLQTMGTANAVLLGAILGGMMCTDMGGPVNKAAYAFGVGLLSTQTYAPMAAIMAAGMVPPLALGLATLVAAVSSIKAAGRGKRRWFWVCALSPKGRFRSLPVTRCASCHAVSSAAR